MSTAEFLDEIYASIVVDGDYARILARLSSIFDSHSGAVMRRDGDFLQYLAVEGLDPSIMEDYNHEYYREDEWMHAAKDIQRHGAAIIGSKLVDPFELEKRAFYRHMLEPHDIGDVMAASFAAGEGPVVYFNFYRPYRSFFTAPEAHHFESIGKHIARAHRLRVALTGATAPANLWLDGLKLTNAERRVADMIVEGRPNAEICESLGITMNTLRWHIRNIFGKASVHSKAQLIAYAYAAAQASTGQDCATTEC
jgi:DNA-binding CsgD family transcriptional regulator